MGVMGGNIETTTKLQFNQQDVITIAVSRAEGMMQAKLSESMALIKATEKEIKETEKAIKSKLDAFGLNHVKEKADAVVAALTALGVAKPRYSVDARTTDQSGGEGADGVKKVRVSIELKTGDNNYSQIGVFHLVDTPQEVVELKGKIPELGKVLSEAREEAVSWRKKLGSVSTLERKYRAKLVERELGKTEEGQALIDSIGFDFNNDVLMLGN